MIGVLGNVGEEVELKGFKEVRKKTDADAAEDADHHRTDRREKVPFMGVVNHSAKIVP